MRGIVSRGEGPVLRVATYNLHDLLDDRAAATRVVRRIGPDVLCLQEVPRRLTTELRLPAFARACGLWWAGGRIGTGGTAVLTALRVRVHARWSCRLPVRFPDRTRGYAAVDVSLGSVRPVVVASVHLGLRAAERERHAEAVLAGLGPRAVVAGDLNEGADGPAARLLASRHRTVSAGEATYPAQAPRSTLDVILASADLAVVEGGSVELDEEDLSAGSDHRPVWVDLALGSDP